MYECTLPLFSWFERPLKDGAKQGNTYTASVGTDPDRGCLSCRTFHYTVTLKSAEQLAKEGEDELKSLFADAHFCEPWNGGVPCAEADSCEYPATEEGLEQVRVWLNQKVSGLEK